MEEISYVSQKLTPRLKVWSNIEREAHAIVWNLKQFETLIFSANIKLYTDQNSLTFLKKKNAPQYPNFSSGL